MEWLVLFKWIYLQWGQSICRSAYVKLIWITFKIPNFPIEHVLQHLIFEVLVLWDARGLGHEVHHGGPGGLGLTLPVATVNECYGYRVRAETDVMTCRGSLSSVIEVKNSNCCRNHFYPQLKKVVHRNKNYSPVLTIRLYHFAKLKSNLGLFSKFHFQFS